MSGWVEVGRLEYCALNSSKRTRKRFTPTHYVYSNITNPHHYPTGRLESRARISIFPSVVLHVFIEAVDTEAGSAEGGRRKPVKVLLTAFFSIGATFF